MMWKIFSVVLVLGTLSATAGQARAAHQLSHSKAAEVGWHDAVKCLVIENLMSTGSKFSFEPLCEKDVRTRSFSFVAVSGAREAGADDVPPYWDYKDGVLTIGLAVKTYATYPGNDRYSMQFLMNKSVTGKGTYRAQNAFAAKTVVQRREIEEVYGVVGAEDPAAKEITIAMTESEARKAAPFIDVKYFVHIVTAPDGRIGAYNFETSGPTFNEPYEDISRTFFIYLKIDRVEIYDSFHKKMVKTVEFTTDDKTH